MLDVISDLCLLFLSLPLTNCAKVTYYEYQNRDVIIEPTENPFRWNKITVPTLLEIDDDQYLNNYESFKIFVYVILSLIFAVLVYWSFRHCMRAYRNRQRPRNVRGRRYNYTRVGGQSGRGSQQERGHNNSIRNQRMTLILNLETHEEESPISIQPEKPPDYFAVVRSDFSAKEAIFLDAKHQETVETPPPAYDENAWGQPNVSK